MDLFLEPSLPYRTAMTNGDQHALLDIHRIWPEGYRAMQALDEAVSTSGLEPSPLNLVKLRASQMNGCAFCIEMHAKDARALGEDDVRLHALHAWRHTPYFSERERAALALAESVTDVATTAVPDEVVDEVREQFSETELTKLVYAIAVINAWNRLATAARVPVGWYQPRSHARA